MLESRNLLSGRPASAGSQLLALAAPTDPAAVHAAVDPGVDAQRGYPVPPTTGPTLSGSGNGPSAPTPVMLSLQGSSLVMVPTLLVFPNSGGKPSPTIQPTVTIVQVAVSNPPVGATATP